MIIALFLSAILTERLPLALSLLHQTLNLLIPIFFFFFHFFISALWTMMTLSGFDNQDWEDAVSGWAEVTLRYSSFSQWSSCSWWVLWLNLSFLDTFSYTSHVLLRSVPALGNCILIRWWLIRAIFGLTNLLDALLQTLWLFKCLLKACQPHHY